MASKALLVRLEAKPGKEAEVEAFLKSALPLVQDELDTVVWFALRMDNATFGIFGAFPTGDGRQAHLSGRVAEVLMARADALLARPPDIQPIEVLASKLPE